MKIGSVLSGNTSESIPANRKLMKKIDIHPWNLDFDDLGVSDYYNPVDERLQDLFSYEAAGEIYSNLVKGNIDKNHSDEVLWLSAIYIVMEMTNSFYYGALIEASSKDGVQLTREVQAFDTFEKYYSDSSKECDFKRRYRNENKASSWLRSLARWIGSSFLKRDSFSRVPPKLMKKNRDILCFAGDAQMAAFAASRGKRLVLGTIEQWFGDLDWDIDPKLKQSFLSTAEQLSKSADSIANNLGYVLPNSLRKSLMQSIYDILEVVSCYLRHIERKSRYLPSELWLGSGGNIYNRTIARAAQKCGATTVSFDHGSGSGWVDLPLIRLIDVDFCDRYLCFTEAQASGIERLRRDGLFVAGGPKPSIEASPFPLFQKPNLTPKVEREKPRAMYVPSLYENGRTFIPPLISEVAEVDFQFKLLKGLRDLGYDVVIKPHPECKIGIPPRLLEATGAVLENRPFEQVCDQADLLLFDYLTTSAIRSAFFTDLPLVLFDHGRTPIQKQAEGVLEQRAIIHRVDRDETNRPRINSEDLRGCIASAKLKSHGTRFRDTYFARD